jgi:uncharacterized protein YqgC (DUF456 family)
LTPLEVGGLTLFILVLLFGAFSILFGFPGTVIIFIDALIYSIITGFEKIGIKILLTLLILSALAEVADFAVGMAGAMKFGVSRKGFWAFTIGGFIGALLLTPFFLGLGLLIGTFLGGVIAILTMELLARNKLKPSLRAAYGAILGRVAGICVKGFFALIMVIITLTSIYS